MSRHDHDGATAVCEPTPSTLKNPEIAASQIEPKAEPTLESPGANARQQRFFLGNVDWTSAIAIGLLHVGCVAAPFFFSWTGLGIALVLWWAAGGLGICLCYHRLLTHRSFKTPKIVELGLTVLGTMSWQGGPVKWVSQHRIHHKHSDHEQDPHSPKHGFNWSHIFWCVFKDIPGHDPRCAAKDLARDRWLSLIDKYHFVPQFVLAGVLFAVGEVFFGLGWSWLLWGVCIRTVFGYHATWFVNSAAHTWGYRNYETEDDSRNNWWVALLSFGEGWHNNHHAAQRSAAHGHRWWEIDLTYWTIRAMGLVGLARDIVRPTRALAHA